MPKIVKQPPVLLGAAAFVTAHSCVFMEGSRPAVDIPEAPTLSQPMQIGPANAGARRMARGTPRHERHKGVRANDFVLNG